MIINNENGLLLMRHDKLGERDWRSDLCYKLIFSPFGKSSYQTYSGDVSIDNDAFFIFNPSVEHKQLETVWEKFLVEVQPSLLQNVAEQLGLKQTSPEFSLISYKHPQIQKWVSFVRDYLSIHDDPDSAANQFFLDNSLTQLAIMMLSYGAGSHQHGFPTTDGKGNIKDVLDALKQSYNEKWTVDEMAVVARMNKYQFAHFFKEELGLSPYSWLQLYRLFRSQQALLYTDETILSIAFQNGFNSVSSYNQLFKKIYRRTPIEFRRIHGFEKYSYGTYDDYHDTTEEH